MSRSTKQSRTTASPIHRVLLAVLLLTSAVGLLFGQQSPPPGMTFEVVSVRVLTDKEAADRSPDFVGPNVSVRLRLSCSGEGFYFYTWGDDITPRGYSVKLTANGVVWRQGRPGAAESLTSPGIEKLDALVPGVWRLMSGHLRPALEWEELDSTKFAGEKHAFTAFVRWSQKDKPAEIVSAAYVVPAGPRAAQ